MGLCVPGEAVGCVGCGGGFRPGTLPIMANPPVANFGPVPVPEPAGQESVAEGVDAGAAGGVGDVGGVPVEGMPGGGVASAFEPAVGHTDPEATGPVPAWELVSDSAVAYLTGLDQAARLALYRRQSARLAEQGHWLQSPAGPLPGPDTAIQAPADVAHRLHGDGLAVARAHADEITAFTAAWYARAAWTACQAVRAGLYLTGRDLEDTAYDPAALPAPDQPAGHLPPWRPDYRPGLPDPAQLATGRADLDEAVAEIHQQLTTAYTAAETAQALGELAGQTDSDQPPSPEQTAAFEQAAALADQIPDLLTWWATTLATTLADQPTGPS
jgi:hypothetical protein